MPVFNTLFKTSMPKNVKKFLTYGRKKIQLLPPHIYSVLNRFIEYEWFTLEVIKECEGKQTYLRHAILKKGKKMPLFFIRIAFLEKVASCF